MRPLVLLTMMALFLIATQSAFADTPVSCSASALISAINTANGGLSPDILSLSSGCTYTLTAVNNTTPSEGGTGLPMILNAATSGQLTINGNGATIVRSSAGGTPDFRLFYVDTSGNLTLNNLTVYNGRTPDSGGGILSLGTLAINNSMVSSNSTINGGGGGIFIYSSTLTMTNSGIFNNSANNGGGGIYSDTGTVIINSATVANNISLNGGAGGLWNSHGTLTINGSTLSGNSAFSSGGGILNDSSSITTLTNSTLTSSIAANGGGIYNQGTLTLNDSTLLGNRTSSGGALENASGTVTLQNSIIGQSIGADCLNSNGAVNAKYSLIKDGSCGASDGSNGNLTGDPMVATSTGPGLGTPVWQPVYYGLQLHSPAINTGNNALIPVGVGTDQPGNPRIFGSKVDMGAYEAQQTPPSCPTFPVTLSNIRSEELIFAINCANSNGANTNDVINLTNSNLTLYLSNNITDGGNGLPVIASAATAGTLTINGNGATIQRVGTAEKFRIFEIAAGGNLILNNVTISQGSSTNGGGILNFGTLTMNNSTVSGNTGNGISNSKATATISNSAISGNNGSGIGASASTVTIQNSTISGNTTTGFGGGLSIGFIITNNVYFPSVVKILNSTITGNTAQYGGGVYTQSGLTLGNSIVAGNTAATPDIDPTVNSLGYNIIGNTTGTTITGTTTGNLIDAAAQPLYLGPLANNGGLTQTMALGIGSVALNAGDPGFASPPNFDQRGTGFPRVVGGRLDIGAFEATCFVSPNPIPAGNTAALIQAINCANSNGIGTNDVINLTNGTYTFTTANNATFGGNALPVIVSADTSGSVTINGNGATIERSAAGGTPNFRLFDVDTDGNLTLNNLTVTRGNSPNGGALLNFGNLTVSSSNIIGNTGTFGGGIYSQGSSLVVINSNVSNNTAPTAGGGISNSGKMSLINSTVSGNVANGSGSSNGGGGLTSTTLANTLIVNSTITNNTATNTSRSGIWIASGPLTIQNSIVANNNGANNCVISNFATLTDGGHNLDNGTSCNFGGATGQNTNPLLGTLANNGGTTQTIAPQAGSPVIDTGDNSKAVDQNNAPLTTDQRGAAYPRIANMTVDIGAYEVGTPCPTFPTTVAAGDTPALIKAITCANINAAGTNDVINLTNSTYTLTSAHNNTDGGNGLPVIVAAGTAGTLTINGNGATITRSSAGATPMFRILEIASGGNLTLNNLTLSKGRTGSQGAGIYNNGGALTVANSTLSENAVTTAYEGGGIYNKGGPLTIVSSTFSGNAGGYEGGGVYNDSGTVTISSSLFTGNSVEGYGGAVFNVFGTVTITDSTLSGNSAGSGGAIMNLLEGTTLIVQNSTISGNNAPTGFGGGIVNARRDSNDAGATATISNSTIANNTANVGGGIRNEGTITVRNSTISGNSIVNNDWTPLGGGIFNQSGATFNLGSSIVAGNSAPNGVDLSGTVNSLGYNVVGNTSGATISGTTTGNLTDGAASPLNLGVLTKNGGPTQTMALGAGSVAINAGYPTFFPPPDYDQRGVGFPRVADGRIDIGAVEGIVTPLISNGTFSAGETGWNFFGQIGHSVSVGVLNFNRQVGATDALIYQDIPAPVTTGHPFELALDLGNSGSSARTVNVVLRSPDWSDYAVCQFALAPNSPLRTHTLQGVSTKNWSSIRLEISPVEQDSTVVLSMDNVTLTNRPDLSLNATKCISPDMQLLGNAITNSSFSFGLALWNPWPTASVAQVNGGVLTLSHPAGAGDFTSVVQTVNQPVALNSHVELTLQLGNNSAVDKRMVAIVRNPDWSGYLVCPFLIPANSSLQTYTLRGRVTVPWASTLVELQLATEDNTGGLLIDNVSLHRIEVPEFLWVTECDGMTVPANLNLVRNGDLSAGLAEWSWWGGITLNADGGHMNLQRQVGAPGASVFQFLNFTTSPGMKFEMSVDLGNSAAVDKSVAVIVRAPDWSEWISCPFTIPANSASVTYTMRGLSPSSWSNMLLEVQLFTDTNAPGLTLDNVSVVDNPALSVTGTECGDAHGASFAAQVTPESTDESTVEPTIEATVEPTAEITDEATVEATTEIVTVEPTSAVPTNAPTAELTAQVTDEISAVPTDLPTALPFPTLPPPASPTDLPTALPFPTLPLPATPTDLPTSATSEIPTAEARPLTPLAPPIQAVLSDPNTWNATSGWSLNTDGTWQTGSSPNTETLTWLQPLDLSSTQYPFLQVISQQTGQSSLAQVQAEDASGTWTTVAQVTGWQDDQTLQLDLSAYRGQIVALRFVWQASVSDVDAHWLVKDILLADAAPSTLFPTASPTPLPTATLTPSEAAVTDSAPPA